MNNAWTASARLAAHAASSDFASLPAATVAAVKAFTLDSIGVGIAGAASPYAAAVRDAACGWGDGNDAHVWTAGVRLPACNAAFANAFQAHCQEFDCVHEAAVLHPFTVVVPVLLAEAEARGMDGETYIAACAAGVDVAVTLGVAATTQIRFFRPATCGLFGAVAALARARGLAQDAIVDAFGYALAFASGTMQAHVEGTPALALQVANAARAAFQAVDLAARGLPGPKGAIEGPFGYLTLFEAGSDLQAALAALPARRRAAEVAWKPFPTGRAAHGGIDMALELGGHCDPEAIRSVEIEATPLILHLVGRPIVQPLEVNYARLCLPFAVAVALTRGGVDLTTFAPEILQDRDVHALAARVVVRANGVVDPAAFTPQTMRITLNDGRSLEARRDILLGAPARPLSPAQQRAKLDGNLAFGFGAPQPVLGDALTSACADLDRLDNAAHLAVLAAGRSS
ncbi:MAG: MmgE/PrpD family protein [Caulobacterales bacterium]|jgi:2-methylcitrate dehydratase PrpD